MKLDVYKIDGKSAGEKIDLADDIFGVEPNDHAIYLSVKSYLANQRQGTHKAKERSEVRGGGRKPFKQKGRGGARAGTSRSPLWVGGGVTFGPRNVRNYKQKINQKMNQLAVCMILSDKVTDEKLIVLEDLPTDGKAKTLADLRKILPGIDKTTILLTTGKDENLSKAAHNLARLDLQPTVDVNVADLLEHQFVLISKKGIEVLEKRLIK